LPLFAAKQLLFFPLPFILNKKYFWFLGLLRLSSLIGCFRQTQVFKVAARLSPKKRFYYFRSTFNIQISFSSPKSWSNVTRLSKYCSSPLETHTPHKKVINF
jgi:hypothetical protein